MTDVPRIAINGLGRIGRALLRAVPTLHGDRTVFRPIPGSMPAITDPPGTVTS